MLEGLGNESSSESLQRICFSWHIIPKSQDIFNQSARKFFLRELFHIFVKISKPQKNSETSYVIRGAGNVVFAVLTKGVTTLRINLGSSRSIKELKLLKLPLSLLLCSPPQPLRFKGINWF